MGYFYFVICGYLFIFFIVLLILSGFLVLIFYVWIEDILVKGLINFIWFFII